MPNRELQECGLALNTGYIIGGSTIVRGEFPFLVLLGYRNDDPELPIRYRCGGALINRKYVLTAAHCHNLDNPYDQIIEVVVGEHDVAVDPDCLNGCAQAQRFKPQEIILHPEYTISSRYWIFIHFSLVQSAICF